MILLRLCSESETAWKSVQIRILFWSLISPNTGKYEPEKNSYLGSFHVEMFIAKCNSAMLLFLSLHIYLLARKSLYLQLIIRLSKTLCSERGAGSILLFKYWDWWRRVQPPAVMNGMDPTLFKNLFMCFI